MKRVKAWRCATLINFISSPLLWLLFEGKFSVGSSDSGFADSKHSFVLLGGKQCDDRVRAHAEIVGWQASPETSGAFLGQRLEEAVWHTFVGEHSVHGLLLLKLGLKVVEW